MRSSFKEFLGKHNFLPLHVTNKNWNQFLIKHQRKEPTKEEIKSERTRIKNKLYGKQGIYVYIRKKNELIYIGKSVNLANRIFAHYKEAFIGIGVWGNFFFRHAGDLTILWREIESDRQRRALEEMLEDIQKSKFDDEFPRGKRKLKNK